MHNNEPPLRNPSKIGSVEMSALGDADPCGKEVASTDWIDEVCPECSTTPRDDIPQAFGVNLTWPIGPGRRPKPSAQLTCQNVDPFLGFWNLLEKSKSWKIAIIESYCIWGCHWLRRHTVSCKWRQEGTKKHSKKETRTLITLISETLQVTCDMSCTYFNNKILIYRSTGFSYILLWHHFEC